MFHIKRSRCKWVSGSDRVEDTAPSDPACLPIFRSKNHPQGKRRLTVSISRSTRLRQFLRDVAVDDEPLARRVFSEQCHRLKAPWATEIGSRPLYDGLQACSKLLH